MISDAADYQHTRYPVNKPEEDGCCFDSSYQATGKDNVSQTFSSIVHHVSVCLCVCVCALVQLSL